MVTVLFVPGFRGGWRQRPKRCMSKARFIKKHVLCCSAEEDEFVAKLMTGLGKPLDSMPSRYACRSLPASASRPFSMLGVHVKDSRPILPRT